MTPLRPTAQTNFTRYQKRVKQLLTRGLSQRQIAEKLEISQPRAQELVNRVYAELGVHNKADALKAIAEGKTRKVPGQRRIAR